MATTLAPESVSSFREYITELNARFLRGVSPHTRAALAAAATQKVVPPRAIITQQDDASHRFYLLLSGRARHFFIMPTGQKSLLMWLSPGDIFGGAALMPDAANYLVGTEALEESTMLWWKRDVIRKLAAADPVLLENAISIAYDYLAWYAATHASLHGRTAKQRLASIVVALAHSIGHRSPAGIELRLSNEELAQSANVTIFTVSRMVAAWQRQGLLKKRRGGVLITDLRNLLSSE